MPLDRLKNSQLPWWIEIQTEIPHCTYYFGTFDSLQEAGFFQHGYVEDLVTEKAQGITVELKKCQPQTLTIEPEFDAMGRGDRVQ